MRGERETNRRGSAPIPPLAQGVFPLCPFNPAEIKAPAQISEPAVAFMRLLDGHQVGDLDPVPVGIDMDEIERGERSPDMEAKYLHPARIQAFIISPAAGIRICLADGKFCRDDALRLLR